MAKWWTRSWARIRKGTTRRSSRRIWARRPPRARARKRLDRPRRRGWHAAREGCTLRVRRITAFGPALSSYLLPMSDAPATLYIVSTPIGNLGDLSQRAIETLKSVSVVLAEDTRHSRPLLARFDIDTPLLSYHEHNESRTAGSLVARMVDGQSMALISDAGTPLLSDPGARLVTAAIESGVRVVPVPGASALLAALVISGIPADRFTYFGFLERKGAARTSALAEIASLAHTAVLYEAAPRVAATLRDLEKHGCGNRLGSVARELTKQFEEVKRGTLSELAQYY